MVYAKIFLRVKGSYKGVYFQSGQQCQRQMEGVNFRSYTNWPRRRTPLYNPWLFNCVETIDPMNNAVQMRNGGMNSPITSHDHLARW